MLGKIILSTIIAGLLAGLVLAGIQHVRLTPSILAAETFETPVAAALAEVSKPCVENMPGMKMCSDEARPVVSHVHEHEAEGHLQLSRGLLTTLASMIAGVGYAILLVGVSLVSNISITKQNGLMWGLCGFIAVALAPAVGLPPELPAMPVAELYPRQIWWFGTICATAVGIYLIAAIQQQLAKVLAVVLIALPHIIGAPVPQDLTSLVPAHLAAHFVANSLGAAAVFWCVLGLLLGYALEKYQQGISEL